MKSRIIILSLCLAGALALPAMALTSSTADVENNPPIAENLTLKTYKGVAIASRFAAVDPEGDLVTFQVVDSPARGQVTMDENDPAAFWYTPYEGKKGKDSFTYVAIDDKGNQSEPATVKITIEKQKTAVTYSDLEGNSAHYAALRLAEAGVYTGRRVGDLYCFEPEGVFSREEFLTMAMTAAGAAPLENVSLTGFYDDGDISAWAKGYVSAALIQGTVEGSSNEAGQVVFNANGPVTCGQAAVIIDRLRRLLQGHRARLGLPVGGEHGGGVGAVRRGRPVRDAEPGRGGGNAVRHAGRAGVPGRRQVVLVRSAKRAPIAPMGARFDPDADPLGRGL